MDVSSATLSQTTRPELEVEKKSGRSGSPKVRVLGVRANAVSSSTRRRKAKSQNSTARSLSPSRTPRRGSHTKGVPMEPAPLVNNIRLFVAITSSWNAPMASS